MPGAQIHGTLAHPVLWPTVLWKPEEASGFLNEASECTGKGNAEWTLVDHGQCLLLPLNSILRYFKFHHFSKCIYSILMLLSFSIPGPFLDFFFIATF